MEEIKLLMVGLESSGKTTILYKLKTGEVTTTIPTVGHNVESVEYKNINFIIWDMGGQQRVRTTWNIHSKNTRALIFVVDSNDRDKIDEARGELHKMLNDESLKEVPLLVYANKQDLDEKMSLHEITEKLNLATLKGRCWYIQATDAIGGEGLYEGLNWLTLALTN